MKHRIVPFSEIAKDPTLRLDAEHYLSRLTCKFCQYLSGLTCANPKSWQCPECGKCNDG